MALHWKWDEKIGEAVFENFIDKKDYTVSLYEGNAFLIFIREFEENGKNMYCVDSFLVDYQHGRKCLGLERGFNNLFSSQYTNLKKLRINKKKSHNWKKIIRLFTEAFDSIEIELFVDSK